MFSLDGSSVVYTRSVWITIKSRGDYYKTTNSKQAILKWLVWSEVLEKKGSWREKWKTETETGNDNTITEDEYHLTRAAVLAPDTYAFVMEPRVVIN